MLCFGICISLQSVSVIAECDLFVVTNDVVVLLVTMGYMSCWVICSLSIDSSFVEVQIFLSVCSCV